MLDKVNATLLHGNGEKLEAFRSRRVIRVTAPHVKKPFIVQEFEDALKCGRTTTLALKCLVPFAAKKPTFRQIDRWMAKYFDEATLESLSHLTNTSIVQGQHGAVRSIKFPSSPGTITDKT